MRIDAIPDVRLRRAELADLDTLAAIDDDAATLFVDVGLDVDFPPDHEFLLHERRRWSACLNAGTALLAIDAKAGPVGFVMLSRLDGGAYIEQLSVRRAAMRRGIGTLLLAAASQSAEAAQERSMLLTTYAHLPWNRAFYERNGYVAWPEAACGVEVVGELEMQRRWLPHPEQRIAMRKSLGGA